MQIQMEVLATCVSDLSDLVLGYYADTNAQDGIPPFKYDWAFYANMEKQDRLVIITTREDDKLLGFAMYLLVNHPHHGGLLTAMCDTLGVATAHRGKGIGKQLVEAAEIYFRTATEVKMMTHGHRAIYDVKPLFPKLDFILSEQLYIKVL